MLGTDAIFFTLEIMAGFGKTDGEADPNEDIIIIHLGRVLSELEYNAVVDSIVKMLNKRFPDQSYKLPS